MFGNQENERKRREKRENEGQKQGPVNASFQKLKLLSTVYYNGLYSPTNMRKYQTNLNNMITLRVKEELIKTESFEHENQMQIILLCTIIFAMIEKIRYDSEISLS